jgi:hypothetical protein
MTFFYLYRRSFPYRGEVGVEGAEGRWQAERRHHSMAGTAESGGWDTTAEVTAERPGATERVGR